MELDSLSRCPKLRDYTILEMSTIFEVPQFDLFYQVEENDFRWHNKDQSGDIWRSPMSLSRLTKAEESAGIKQLAIKPLDFYCLTSINIMSVTVPTKLEHSVHNEQD